MRVATSGGGPHPAAGGSCGCGPARVTPTSFTPVSWPGRNLGSDIFARRAHRAEEATPPAQWV